MTLLVLVFGLWAGWVFWPRRVPRKDRMTAWTEFHGGPKDGDRERLALDLTVLSLVRYVPLVLSPWGEQEATDLCRVVRIGRYVRSDRGMDWHPEEE